VAALLPPVRPIFRAAAEAFVPEVSQLPPEEWEELESIVEFALARRPAALRKQIIAFMRLLDLMPLAAHGTRLRKLDPRRRTAFLNALQRSRLLLVRRGVWGLRTLVFMGYYTRSAAARAVGYNAHPRGWLSRREAMTSLPETRQ
jgi:hypothetical protein